MPQVKIPGELQRDDWNKMEEYTDGFVLTVAITLLALVAVGLFWLVTK